jgi:hypothetical protein
MDPTPQIESLIDKLLELSREGKVNWQETANEQKFLAAVSKFVVTIGFEDETNWTNASYGLEVSDQAGKALENVTLYRGDLRFAELQELHTLARRRALRVDEALSDLLSTLTKIS